MGQTKRPSRCGVSGISPLPAIFGPLLPALPPAWLLGQMGRKRGATQWKRPARHKGPADAQIGFVPFGRVGWSNPLKGTLDFPWPRCDGSMGDLLCPNPTSNGLMSRWAGGAALLVRQWTLARRHILNRAEITRIRSSFYTVTNHIQFATWESEKHFFWRLEKKKW